MLAPASTEDADLDGHRPVPQYTQMAKLEEQIRRAFDPEAALRAYRVGLTARGEPFAQCFRHRTAFDENCIGCAAQRRALDEYRASGTRVRVAML